MKNLSIFFLMICMMIFLFSCSSTDEKSDGGTPLKGYWSLDEDGGDILKDSAGNNNGKLLDRAERKEGKSGKGVYFSGNSHLTIPHKNYFNSDSFTFSIWVKLQNSGYQYIVWKNGDQCGAGEPPTRRMDIWADTEGFLNLVWHNEEGTRTKKEGNKSITDNKWHHIALVYDEETIALYLDGKADIKEPLTEPLAKNNAKIWIGDRPGNSPANGSFDEIKFFIKALSEKEIEQLASE